MVVNKEIKRILEKLSAKEPAMITLSGMPIAVRFFDEGGKLALATSVYEGGNYIPSSVRKSLSLKAPFKARAIHHTFLKIDEERFQVSLNFLGQLEPSFSNETLNELIEEFNELAGEWRLFLEDRGKSDLIHVKAP